MQLDLRTSEWVVCVFFAYLVVLSCIRPLAAAALLGVAAGITIGTVLGRYHYAVDSLSGVLVGVLGWWVAFHALGA